jgi:hypothetical protein
MAKVVLSTTIELNPNIGVLTYTLMFEFDVVDGR